MSRHVPQRGGYLLQAGERSGLYCHHDPCTLYGARCFVIESLCALSCCELLELHRSGCSCGRRSTLQNLTTDCPDRSKFSASTNRLGDLCKKTRNSPILAIGVI